jgi:DNA polymerase III delta subunit
LREFNESAFSLLTDAVQSAIAAAEQLPMMSDTRVVRIRDFAKLREADEDVLIRYLNNPAPTTVMILIADELDKRKKATKVLLDTCTVVDFPTLKDAEAKAWAKSRLKELKVHAGRSGVKRHHPSRRNGCPNAFQRTREAGFSRGKALVESHRIWSTN